MKKRRSFAKLFYDAFLKASCEDAAEECIAMIMKEAENKNPKGNKYDKRRTD